MFSIGLPGGVTVGRRSAIGGTHRGLSQQILKICQQHAQAIKIGRAIPAGQIGRLNFAKTSRWANVLDHHRHQLALPAPFAGLLVHPLAFNRLGRPQDHHAAHLFERVLQHAAPGFPGRNPPVPPDAPAGRIKHLGNPPRRVPVSFGIAQENIGHFLPR